jgi:hypothetical protein
MTSPNALARRLTAVERARRPPGDTLAAWRTLLSSDAPTAAEVSNLLVVLPGVPPLRTFARELLDADLTQLSVADQARVRAAVRAPRAEAKS